MKGALIAVVTIASASSADAQRCTTTAASAELFAPNLADSGRLFRGTFSPDGQTLYYFRKVTPGKEDYRIYTSHRDGAEWSDPVRLDLGGDYSDLYPSVSPDGRRLVFISYRAAPGDTARAPNGYLWYAERQGDRWGPPVFLAAATEFGMYHSGPVIAQDYSIHFHRTSADWRRKWSLHARWNGQGYESAVPTEDEELLKRWSTWKEGRYHIWGATQPRADLLLIEMSEKDERGRPRPPELWVSRRTGNEWRDPYLAPAGVNTPATENFFTLTPDGCSLLFVRAFSAFYLVGLEAILEAKEP